jgi:hypothetical protein
VFDGADKIPAIECVTSAPLDKNKKYELVIKEHRKRRSKDANAYFWEFLDQLATKMRMGKRELYRELIRDIGGVSTIVCTKNEAVPVLIDKWAQNGIGWFADIEESKIEGCSNVILYYGSSTYDSSQMSRLIDRLIFECNIVGIDTTDLKTKALLEV